MINVCGGRLSAAILSCLFTALLAAPALSQTTAKASQTWARFTAANPGFRAEWASGGDRAVSLRGLSAPAGGSPEHIAEGFLAANGDLLGIASAAGNLRLDNSRDSVAGHSHVMYQQLYRGLPVFNGFVDVHMNGRNQVYLVNSNYSPDAAARSMSVQASLPASRAIQSARAAHGSFRLFDKAGLPLASVAAPVTEQPVLGVQQTAAGDRLAWRLAVGAVQYTVDANTGAVLDAVSLMQSATVNGTGRVFDPNPINTLNNATLRDRANAAYAALNPAYVNRPLTGITQLGTGPAARFHLRGAFVNMMDMTAAAIGSCMAGQPEVRLAPPVRVNASFLYNRAQSGFEHTMVYRHLDANQRYIRSIGFLSLFNRSIRVDAHAFTQDNAFYCRSPVGAGYLAFGDGGVDDAEDADVVLHEYGHALQDAASRGRYVGGGQAGAMGEGFGDWWAFSYKSTGRWAVCFADWDSESRCLRRLDTNKKFPANYVNQVHRDGEIWSRGLRELFIKLGKTKADKIVLMSHFLIATGPTFSKGVAALLDADRALYQSANKRVICSAFVDRGIGAPGCGYWVRMTWNKLGADVDLSMIPPSATGWLTVNYINDNPPWGDPSTTGDDPILYEDCISTCTAEEITVAGLGTPGTYRVRAHYYSDHGKGPSTVIIEVFQGPNRLFAGSRVLAATGAEWLAVDIVVPTPAKPDSAPRIVLIDRVIMRPPGYHGTK